MRKIATLFSLILLCVLANTPVAAQANDESSNPSHFRNPLWLGFNTGAAWQTSGVPAQLGWGGGVTLGQNYLTYTPSKVFIGWRFRYLGANTYGQDYKRNYGISKNIALNGTTDSTLDYAHHGGFVFNNYKMTLNELSLEMLIGPNLINHKTGSGPLLYIFGGVGLVKTQTLINARDANGARYNYSKIDTTGSKTQIINALSAIQDNSYETVAEGSASPSWHFMPSLGIGLGYQFRNVFQLGVEYKLTFALNDPIDGLLWNGDNTSRSLNDKYNYGGFYIKLGLGGHHHATQTTDGYSGNTNNTNNHTTDLVDHTPPPVGSKPKVLLVYPSANPYYTSKSDVVLNANLEYVPDASDISVTVNGQPVNAWHFNHKTGALHGDFNLVPGQNIITITGTNAYGSDSKSEYVEYSTPVVTSTVPPPYITVNTPYQTPYNTTVNYVAVSAQVLNISNAAEIQVKVNGGAYGNFAFDPATHILQFTAPLSEGNNYIYIHAANGAGADSKSLSVYFIPGANSGGHLPKPIVTLSSSITNPYPAATANLTVYATVDNVFAQNQIKVMVNGAATTNFVFEPATKQVHFVTVLNPGNNYFYIRATNESGSDSKSFDAVYNPATSPAPVVRVLSPTANPQVTTASSLVVSATVQNVIGRNQITVSLNGRNTQNYTYTPASNLVELNVPLGAGTTRVVVSATNAVGSDSKSVEIDYSDPVTPRPVITILSPGSHSFTTNTSSVVITASVMNVNSQADIQLKINGQFTGNFTFNPTSHVLSFTSSLNIGNNYFYISASNAAGSDNKSLDVTYTLANPKPIVTITSPGSVQTTTSNGSVTVLATVQNVNAQSEIQVNINGAPFPHFLFNPVNQVLEFSATLSPGNTLFTIVATNSAGSDSKSTTVVYTPPPAPKPVVVILSPNANPYYTANNQVSVIASVANVSSQNDIQIKVNGAGLSNFTFNAATHQVQFSTGLNVGNNYFYIGASNSSGSDSKNLNVILSAPVPRPVVLLITPIENPYRTDVPTCVITASVDNISQGSDLRVLQNNNQIVSFSYDAGSKKLKIETSLQLGQNKFDIVASNASGSDTKSILVVYTSAEAPSIRILSPMVQFGGHLKTMNPIVMKVQNVNTLNELVVKWNGGTLTRGLMFDPIGGTLTFTPTYQVGVNKLDIQITNRQGAVNKTFQLEYNPN
jgi:hypothetical protein